MKSWEFFDLLLNKISVVGTPGSGFELTEKGISDLPLLVAGKIQ